MSVSSVVYQPEAEWSLSQVSFRRTFGHARQPIGFGNAAGTGGGSQNIRDKPYIYDEPLPLVIAPLINV